MPLTLIVANVALCFTEHNSVMAKITNVVLPLGLFYLIVGICRRIGVIVWCMLPLVIFAGFQIVLLQLYGESIISVDMFVNVATTNVSEASELLGNLLLAVFIVILLYVPMLANATVCLIRHHHTDVPTLRRVRTAGLTLTCAGAVLLAVTYAVAPGFKIEREVFPIDVASNLYIAVKRTVKSSNYDVTSRAFTHHAAFREADTTRQVHVVVIGETARGANWQLGGYSRPTNPRLSQRGDIVYFTRVLSESNVTHKSVPMLLSYIDSRNFYDSIYTAKSVFEAMEGAGYETAFISNQRPNRSFIDYFGRQAGTTRFLLDHGQPVKDMALVKALSQYLDSARSPRQMVVLHSYGSHFKYRERYPDAYSRFRPDDVSEATSYNRRRLLNAYDNTIVYTDALLDSLINTLQRRGVEATLTYVSDHGEDIYDDSRERFLHASPVPTAHQLYVPMVLWMSPQYRRAHPHDWDAARANASRDVSSSASLFHTVLDLARVTTPYWRQSLSLTAPNYAPGPRYYLNDYLDAVPLSQSALRAVDRERLARWHISIR